MKRTIIALVGLWAGMLSQADARTSTNRWQGGTAKWETTKQWSLNKLPNDSQDIVIANPGTFTVTIDDQTASNSPGVMTVSSLSMSNTAGLSTLLLTNRPASTIPITLTISNSASIGPGSILNLVDASSIGAGVNVQASNLTADTTILLPSNVTLSVSNSLLLGSTASRTGIISVVGGTLIASPSVGNGSLLISNGVLQAGSVNVGVLSGARGLWQIAGGSNSANSIAIGVASGATGDVVLAGGELSPSGGISVGEQGLGRLVVSNGFLQTGQLNLGLSSGGHGIWQIAGGSNAASAVAIGSASGATGEVFVTGGQLTATYLALGGNGNSSGGVGSLVISNGEVDAAGVFMANSLNGVGTVTVAGGTLSVKNSPFNGQTLFMVGYYGTGTVWQTGGEIDVLPTSNGFDGLIRLVGEDADGTYLGQLVCSGGVLRASEMDVGHPDGPTSSGSSLWTIAGGTSIVSRAVYVVNRPNHIGLLTITDGLLQTPSLELGTVSGGGSVVVSGGVLQVASTLFVGEAPGPPSQLTIAGGMVNVVNNSSFGFVLGTAPGSRGVVSISGGTLNASTMWIGGPQSEGTLTLSGGVLNGTELLVGESAGSTGVVSYTGGALHEIGVTVGDAGFGSFFVSSNADFQPAFLQQMVVGNQNGAVGSLSVQGGILFGSLGRVLSSLQIGLAMGSMGTVWVTDGALFAGGGCGDVVIGSQGSGQLSVTNSTVILEGMSIGSMGTLECVNSQLDVGGCAAINSNVMLFVNSTGDFSASVQNTGSIIANGSTLTFDLPVDNSGLIVLTNGTAQFSGGISNSGAVLLGANQFCVTSVVATGSDVAITWPVFGGNHYRVQAAGSITDSFSDITADIVPPSDSGLGVTNYLDAGSLTNFPGRFYRIRQIY